MTRLEALEAVAKAADDMEREGVLVSLALYDSLKALRALPTQPQPQGETVTLAVWECSDGETVFCKPGSALDNKGRLWTRLGTVTLPLDRERGE